MGQPREYTCECCGAAFDPREEGIVYIVAGAPESGVFEVPDGPGLEYLGQLVAGPLNSNGESVARREYRPACYVRLFGTEAEEVERVALAVEAGNDPEAREIARAARHDRKSTAAVMAERKAARAEAE